MAVPLGAIWAVAFTLACSVTVVSDSRSGSVRISVTAVGDAPDTIFFLRFDSDTTTYEVHADTVVTFSATEGTHSIGLEGVADNCLVGGGNPRSIDVVAGEETDVPFVITCTINGYAKVTIATTGEDIDDMYTLDFNSGFRTVLVGPNQFVRLSMPVGAYVVGLTGVAANCTVSGGPLVQLEVIAQQTATASFAVVCVAK
ncbi:MAG TPA: hypothetical protein VLH75_13255 [Longimicrobiales bacterium]|nr:hypothetical protein [Longimicrobiales bacterium]